jgi:hypothetical protein
MPGKAINHHDEVCTAVTCELIHCHVVIDRVYASKFVNLLLMQGMAAERWVSYAASVVEQRGRYRDLHLPRHLRDREPLVPCLPRLRMKVASPGMFVWMNAKV